VNASPARVGLKFNTPIGSRHTSSVTLEKKKTPKKPERCWKFFEYDKFPCAGVDMLGVARSTELIGRERSRTRVGRLIKPPVMAAPINNTQPISGRCCPLADRIHHHLCPLPLGYVPCLPGASGLAAGW
ncbi:hypothetical protein BaRGS_00029335, partial [Batillaria attramentaria]